MAMEPQLQLSIMITVAVMESSLEPTRESCHCCKRPKSSATWDNQHVLEYTLHGENASTATCCILGINDVDKWGEGSEACKKIWK